VFNHFALNELPFTVLMTLYCTSTLWSTTFWHWTLRLHDNSAPNKISSKTNHCL